MKMFGKMMAFVYVFASTVIYLGGLLGVLWGLYTDNNSYISMGFVAMIPTQLIWGLVVGPIYFRRGWHAAGPNAWPVTNLIGMFFITGLLAPPVSMLQALDAWARIGKLFPTPKEQTWG